MSEKDKHAYLIMAHHRLDVLEKLVTALDDIRNDIYIHIDAKCKEDYSNIKTKYSKLYFLDRNDINWGGPTQIICELNLIKAAVSNQNYKYLHLLTGVTYPIKSQDYIHDFFNKNSGKEFIGFSNSNCDERVKYIHLFNEIGKSEHKFHKRLLILIRKMFLKVQYLLHVDCFKKYNLVCKKGLVYFSITGELAKYIITQENKIKEFTKHSLCGDALIRVT